LRLLRLDKAELVRQPKAYVYTIAAHVVHQFRMRMQEKPGHLRLRLPLIWPPRRRIAPCKDRLAESLSAEREIAVILNRLPPMHRAVLLLCKRDGCSYDEIASRLELSVAYRQEISVRSKSADRGAD